MKTHRKGCTLLLGLIAAGCSGGDDGLTPGRDSGQSDASVSDAAVSDAAGTGSEDAGDRVVSFGTAGDSACDLNGYWAVRQTVINEAIGVPQVATTWYFMAIRQDGEEVRVEDHLDCGADVDGTVDVTLPRATLVNLARRNVQRGRTGTFVRDGDRCQLQMERFWSVRGADPETYLPEGRNAETSLSALQDAAPLPSESAPEGAEDDNGPDYAMPGVAWVVRGAVSGTRWSVQRDWQEWLSDAEHPITAGDSDSELTAGVRFDNEENVLTTDPPDNSLLRSGSTPRTRDPRNQVTLRRLGEDADEPEVQALLSMGIAERCFEVQSILPAFTPPEP